MKVAPQSDSVREIVMRAFAELSGEPTDPSSLAEVLLIHEGKYRGRSYRSGGLLAMWMMQLGLVQVYDEDGEMLRTINLFQEQAGLRRAA